MSTPSSSSTHAGPTDSVDLTIAEAATLLAQRSVSALELVEATMRRIEETEPRVHAYATVFAEEARRDARQADRERAHGHCRGPLHGIPVGVKDLVYMKGTPTEAGSRVLAGFIPPYDATVVARLRQAGAIVVGKTVTHEFAYGANDPPTRNPWNLDCYPGGSSAGSGVAVAVRSAFGTIGTDTGGSIRVPAAMNNIVGLKPTFGRVSRYGIVPLSPSLDHAGPLARTVEDCALLLQAIAGYDPLDSGSIDHPIADYRAELEAGTEGRVIGVERGYAFYEGVSDDVRAAVDAVISDLQRQGAKIVAVKMPELNFMATVLLTILLPEASACHRRWLRERWAEYDAATRVMLELGELVPGTHYITAQRVRRLLRETMKNVFRAYQLDALLSPTLPITTVPRGQRSAPGETGEAPMTALLHHTPMANITGQPALSAPCGFSTTGLPIGYQLIGRPFAEATLFRLARAYERNRSWETHKPEQ
jgi:aspartyl-tRNA(Asn)/glutamyl-tRNA(Gln) amidotransferase subunit A